MMQCLHAKAVVRPAWGSIGEASLLTRSFYVRGNPSIARLFSTPQSHWSRVLADD